MRERHILRKLEHRRHSIFFVHLLLMVIMLSVAMSPLLANSKISADTLMEYYCEELEQSVDQGCEHMSTALFRTYAIPGTLQGNKYYQQLAEAKGDDLAKTYAWILPHLETALGEQVYLAGDSVERLIYIPEMDSICTSDRSFVKAEDCFDQYLSFEDTDTETLMELLKKRNGFSILPMQELHLASAAPTECMALIIRPAGADISVMTIYEKDTILAYLGVNALPKGSCLRITDAEGAVIMEEGLSAGAVPTGSYELTSRIELFGLQLQLWVPMDYFEEMLQPAYRTSMILSLGTAVVGFFLCILFADISTRKIRRLARVHLTPKYRSVGSAVRGDEVDYLAHVISESQNKTETLQQKMFSGALVRAFSGVLLLKNDEEVLRPCFEAMEGDYRVALVELPPEVNFALKTTILPENLTVPCFCESISDKSAGLLFPASNKGVEELSNVLRYLSSAVEQSGETIVCGISEPISTPERLYIAVRQARLAMQGGEGICVYARESMQKADESMLWIRHQRLYQCILEQNEEGAKKAIRDFIQNSGTGQEGFYNTVFILRSAAEELELEFFELDEAQYESHLQIWENVGKLEHLLHRLLEVAREKDAYSGSDPNQQILQYIKKNSMDPELCLTSVATHFGISEKKVYTIVQKATGMKFREYTLMLRMRKAAHLLVGTQKRVEEVAQECGYSAESTFFRVFKNYYNCTPSQYRKNGEDTAEGDDE